MIKSIPYDYLVNLLVFFGILIAPIAWVFHIPVILDTNSITFFNITLCVICVWFSNHALSSDTQSDEKETLDDRKRMDNERYLWWNVFAFSLNIVILWQNEWWYGSSWLFDERWPKIPCSRSALLLIHMEIAHYLYGIVTYLFLPKEYRKSDHMMMTFHHFIAAGLLILSAMTNFWKFAVIVLFLHDGCDIFLAGAKKARYANSKKIITIMFACLAISWPILRLAWFGHLIFSIVFPPKEWLEKFNNTFGSSSSIVRIFLVGPLSMLMVMNIIWYAKIMKIAFSGDLKDTREKSE